MRSWLGMVGLCGSVQGWGLVSWTQAAPESTLCFSTLSSRGLSRQGGGGKGSPQVHVKRCTAWILSC